MSKLEPAESSLLSKNVEDYIGGVSAANKIILERLEKSDDPNFIRMVKGHRANVVEALFETLEICEDLGIDNDEVYEIIDRKKEQAEQKEQGIIK